MAARVAEDESIAELQEQLKALGNRYAVEILQVLSPRMGDIIPNLGWDGIVDGVLQLHGLVKPVEKRKEGRTQEEVQYQKARQKFVSGGTLYETMNKLIKVGFVVAEGERGRKNRQFRITHDGRLALSAISGMRGPITPNTEVQKAAQVLLRHKNFTTLMPAQGKFLEEIGAVDNNLVIQMPPGSGKTFLAMIAILIRLERGVKCLYVTPYTSLNTQVIDEYGELFESLGYSVVRHDGSHRSSQLELDNADLVVSVIESVLSAVVGGNSWTNDIGLAVIDELSELDSAVIEIEAQNLGTDRSTKLDVLITQLKSTTQLIALSSRFGETDEIANWLEADVFRPSVRLEPDEFIVTKGEKGVEILSADGTHRSRFSTGGILTCVLKHMKNYEEKAFLIVVGSRDAAESIARDLAATHPREISKEKISEILGPEKELPVTTLLDETLKQGVAFHHAGLDPNVRQRLERSIKDGQVKTIVSTTGITSGISFPLDSVIILFGLGLFFLVSRSRYLQIAGRIGEYYLARNGGSVYLVFESPTRQFPTVEKLEETLLHKPLEPLTPGPLHPALAASLIMKDAATGRSFTRNQAKQRFSDFVNGTFRGSVDEEYSKQMNGMFGGLFGWLVKTALIEEKKDKFNITKEGKAAVSAGLNPMEYVAVRKNLDDIDLDTDEGFIIDLLMHFRIPQTIRPRAQIPSKIELKLANLEMPSDRYGDFKQKRDNIKKLVLMDWVNEMSASDIIDHALDESRRLAQGQRPPVGSDLGEGDVEALVAICSDIAWSLSQYLGANRKRGGAQRLELMSKQLHYGVRKDLAASDLFELVFQDEESNQFRTLSRVEIRTLYDKGYTSISDIVRKDIDADKPGFARDRFAKNCGLELNLAKTVYIAAMEHLKAGYIEGD
ncbi:MAG: DEAD/DEAH box helicase [Promethearchaeota archaeon]